MKPSGVQFASPMRPPGRSTRSISLRGTAVVGREHHAEGGQHDVEGAVGEGQRLGIGDLELHVQALGLGARAAFVQQ